MLASAAVIALSCLPPQGLELANATVHTGTSASWSGSLVVRDGLIQPAGSTRAAGAPFVDLAGAFVVPGLQDAHGHLLGLGSALAEVDLTGTDSFDEVIARTARAARRP